jgi:hypothetical protein
MLAHPKIPDLYYCRECHQIEFPPCEASGCTSFGTIRCSHVDADSERSCNRAFCAEHARRWQVYGPHRIGLGRCPEHSALSNLPVGDVLFQVAAGTEVRRQAGRKGRREDWVRLPSLQAIGHILTKAKLRSYRPQEVNAHIETLLSQLDPSKPLQAKMAQSLKEHGTFRKQNLERDVREREQGLPHFDKLVKLVRSEGLDEIAMNLQFVDFRPKDQLLFVRLEADLRGRFIGRGGHRKAGYERALGVRVLFEKGSG